MNSEDFSVYCGYVAGGLIFISNSFQIKKMIDGKTGENISLIYLSIFLVVSSLYMTSGIISNIPYLYIFNAIYIPQYILMISIKIFYDKKNKISEDREKLTDQNDNNL